MEPRIVHRAIRRILISWELPSLAFFNVNFDDSVMGSIGRAEFVIKCPNSRLVVAGVICLFGHSIPEVELYAALTGIDYARHSL